MQLQSFGPPCNFAQKTLITDAEFSQFCGTHVAYQSINQGDFINV